MGGLERDGRGRLRDRRRGCARAEARGERREEAPETAREDGLEHLLVADAGRAQLGHPGRVDRCRVAGERSGELEERRIARRSSRERNRAVRRSGDLEDLHSGFLRQRARRDDEDVRQGRVGSECARQPGKALEQQRHESELLPERLEGREGVGTGGLGQRAHGGFRVRKSYHRDALGNLRPGARHRRAMMVLEARAAAAEIPEAGPARGLAAALRAHWPEYLMESALLGLFMVAACGFTALLEHPGSPVRQALGDGFLRRGLMGLAMGADGRRDHLLAVGQALGSAHQSGHHADVPAARKRVEPADALFYAIAQCAGAVLGVVAASLALVRRRPAPVGALCRDGARRAGRGRRVSVRGRHHVSADDGRPRRVQRPAVEPLHGTAPRASASRSSSRSRRRSRA